MRTHEAMAAFGATLATDLLEVSHDPAVLDSGGWWAVTVTYEGSVTCARFGNVGVGAAPAAEWIGPAVSDWTSSLDKGAYMTGVESLRQAIARGDVYQANLCRVLTAPLPDPERADIRGLAALLQDGNPAPYAGFVSLPDHGVAVATASPELFLRRQGSTISSGPIKGTGVTAADLLPKDVAENVMIVDLVRNDLSRVATVGSVAVPALLAIEQHPGLVHLVSTVSAELAPAMAWTQILQATFPPGSVTGAPKSSALRLLADLEPVPRGPYCGAIGWVDADRGTAELAVGIRTFWREGDVVKFGTGAGITWGSDPAGEWEETELKARRLLTVASRTWQG